MKNNKTIESSVHDLLSQLNEDKSEVKKELQSAYNSLKSAKGALKGGGKKNEELKELKKGMRKLADGLEELEDIEMTETEESETVEVTERNKNSEGYGTFKGLGMDESTTTKVIKLSESDLKRVIRRVVEQQSQRDYKTDWSPIRNADNEDIVYGCLASAFEFNQDNPRTHFDYFLRCVDNGEGYQF